MSEKSNMFVDKIQKAQNEVEKTNERLEKL